MVGGFNLENREDLNAERRQQKSLHESGIQVVASGLAGSRARVEWKGVRQKSSAVERVFCSCRIGGYRYEIQSRLPSSVFPHQRHFGVLPEPIH